MDSPSRANANSTAKTGANPLIAPAMFGPISLLDSKFNRVTVAGNSNPTHMNNIAACMSAFVMSTRNGAKHQNNSVDVGTLTAAPSHGGIHLNATWVRTNAAPKPNVELSASRTAIGVSRWIGRVRLAKVATLCALAHCGRITIMKFSGLG